MVPVPPGLFIRVCLLFECAIILKKALCSAFTFVVCCENRYYSPPPKKKKKRLSLRYRYRPSFASAGAARGTCNLQCPMRAAACTLLGQSPEPTSIMILCGQTPHTLLRQILTLI